MDLVVVSAPKGKVNYTTTKSATQPPLELASNNRKQRQLEQGVNFLLSGIVKLQPKLFPHSHGTACVLSNRA